MRINQHVIRLLIWSIYVLNTILIGGDLYLYDPGMLHEKKSYPIPEIKIPFQKLDEEFESTIRKFVKSYNGWSVIKERLEKEYGIMESEDIGIKDELEGLHLSLENADDEIRIIGTD